MKSKYDSVVVLSGGQDSVTCLINELYTNSFRACAIAFDYGQRHSVELEQAAHICNILGVDFTVHKIPSLSMLGNSALLEEGDISAAHPSNENLPASFVPNRNALFLTIAHAYAQSVGAHRVVTGVCQTDYSGYPDCRAEFIDHLANTLNLGYQTSIAFITPLMYIDKAATFDMARIAGMDMLKLVINETHTCYEGDRETLHEWGHGCGECPACKLREAGWNKFLETNYPTPEELERFRKNLENAEY